MGASRPPPWPLLIAAAVLALIGVVIAQVHAIGVRGPWYDEFYTFYVASPRFGFREALVAHWLPDNHPPTYYALSWLTSDLGPGLEQRRLVNVGIAILAALILALMAWRWPARRTVLLVYAVLLAASPIVVLTASELRSNLMAFCAAAVATGGLGCLAVPGPRPLRSGECIALTAILAVTFSVHFATTVFVGALAAAFGLRLLVTQQWLRAAQVLAIGIVASLPLAATLFAQLSTIGANTRAFWIEGGLHAARWAYENEAIAIVSANVPATLAGLCGLALIARASWRAGKLADDSALVLTLAGGMVLGIAMLTAIHMVRPIVINRYLVALTPPAFFALAIGLAYLLPRVSRSAQAAGLLVLLLATAYSQWVTSRSAATLASWSGTANAVAAVVQSCPGTLVHADLVANRDVMTLPPADNAAVMRMAYAYTARSHGFALEPDRSIRMAEGCPTLFWAEHVAGKATTGPDVARRLRAEGYAIGAYRFRRIGNGWILKAEPPPS